ncbi:MAG: histidine kinase [Chitinophagales bacterium]|nr:histidine kinase [Chitinophagales bacterium]
MTAIVGKNKKRYLFYTIIIVVLILHSSLIYGQTEKLVNTSKVFSKTEQADSFLNLSINYLNKEYDLNLAQEYAQKVLSLSTGTKNNQLLSKAHGIIGIVYMYRGILDTAENHILISYKYAKASNNDSLVCIAQMRIGGLKANMSKSDEAMAYFLKALQTAKHIKNYSLIVDAHYKLAGLYASLNQLNKVKEHLYSALEIIDANSITIEDDLKLNVLVFANAYNLNMKKIEPNNNEYDKEFLRLSKQSLDLALKIKNYNQAFSTLLQISIYYKDINNYTLSDKYLNNAMSYLKYSDVNNENMFNVLKIDMLIRNDKKKDAIALIEQFSDTTKTLPLSLKYNTNEIAYLRYKELSMYEKALEKLEITNEYKNRIQEEEQLKLIKELETQYEVDKKDAQIREAKLKQALNKRRTIIFASLLGLIILILAIAYLYNRSRYLKTQLKMAQLQNDLHRSQLNPHFIYNSINAIQPFLYNQSDPNKGAAYLSDVSIMIRNMLDATFDDFWTLQKELDFIIQYCQVQEQILEYKVDLKITCNEKNKALLLPSLILQPFIENCFVHGFQNTDEEKIIDLNIKTEYNYILINIINNSSISKEKQEQKIHVSRAMQITLGRLQSAYPKYKNIEKYIVLHQQDNKFIAELKIPIS